MKDIVLIVIVGLLIAGFGAGHAFAANLYVVNNSNNTVTVIDTTQHNAVIETIVVGASPTGIAYNPTNKKAYVVNRGDNTVTVIDTLTNAVSGTVPVNPYAWYVATDPITHNIDLNEWVKDLPVNYVYVTSAVNNSVDILITTFDGLLTLPGGSIKTDLPPGIGAFNLALDVARQEAYVVNCHNNILSILDLKSKAMVAKVEDLDDTDGFIGVGVDTGFGKVYTVNDMIDVVPVVDVETRKVTGKIKVGKTPFNVIVDSFTHRAYVANRGSNTVSVIDTAKDTVEATVKVGSEPVSVALADGMAYVANCGDSTISVMDTATNTVVDTIVLPGVKPFRGLCHWSIAAF